MFVSVRVNRTICYFLLVDVVRALHITYQREPLYHYAEFKSNYRAKLSFLQRYLLGRLTISRVFPVAMKQEQHDRHRRQMNHRPQFLP